ncbi:flagellar export protein FliJ [Sulfurimonas sp.]
MKTRFSSLVGVKKNTMQKSESAFQKANATFMKASAAVEESLTELYSITSPTAGQISDFLANRTLLEAQRALIAHNKEWVAFSQNEMLIAKQTLQKDTIEYEKFKYLEFEEQKRLIKEAKIKEAKDLDEIALMTYANKDKKKALM